MRRTLAAVVLLAAAGLPARAANPEALLPAETETIIRLNIRQLLDSDLFKKYAKAQLEQALKGNEAQKTLQKLGMDPLKDVDSLTGGLWGDNPQEMSFLFVLAGKFDPEKLFAAVEEEAKKNGDKVSIVKDGDVTLVKVVAEKRPDPLYLSVADKNTVVLGSDKKVVVDAMKADPKAAKSAVKKELVELYGKQDAKASLTVVALSNGKVGNIPPNPLVEDPDKLKKQLEKLQSVAMTLRVTGDVGLEVVMGMKDKDAADDFGATLDDLLNKVKGLLPFAAAQNPNFKPVVNELTKTLKSSVKDGNVVLSAKVSADAIGKAAGSDD